MARIYYGVGRGFIIRGGFTGNASTERVAIDEFIRPPFGAGIEQFRRYGGSSSLTADPMEFSTEGGSTTGSASGIGTVTGVSGQTITTVGSATGLGSATGSDALIWASVGSSSGVNTTTGLSVSVLPSVGSITGLGTSTGVSSFLLGTIGSSTGLGASTGASANTFASVGSSAGIGTSSGTSGSLNTTGSTTYSSYTCRWYYL